MNSVTVFGLIRHGRTRWNAEHRIQGWRDSPLSREGEAMARHWGKRLASLGWDRILASDLGRARQTAELVNRALGLDLATDPRLREQDWGQWSGLRLPELRRDLPRELERQESRGWEFRPPGGESRRELLARVRTALEDAHRCHPGQRILVVCHEGVIKTVLYHLLGRAFLPTEKKILRRGYFLHLARLDDQGLTLERDHALALEERP